MVFQLCLHFLLRFDRLPLIGSFYSVRSVGKVERIKGREEEKGGAQSNLKMGKGVLLSKLSVNLI
jgi:hypothetical protein